MNASLRPVEVDDLDALSAIDAAYAAAHDVPRVVTRASLAFYGRSGHAFVVGPPGAGTGFALAHAVWDGARATVNVARTAVAAGDDGATDTVRALVRALLEAVVKSAYDAAVYDLVADVPASDAATSAILAETWRERPTRRFERALGARGADAASGRP